MPLWVFQPIGSPLASSLLLNSVMGKKSCEYILEVNVNEQKKKMVKITYRMKNHGIPTRSHALRGNAIPDAPRLVITLTGLSLKLNGRLSNNFWRLNKPNL